MDRKSVPHWMRSPQTAALDRLAEVQRQAVLARYARLSSSGRPLVCQPSQKELSGTERRREPNGTTGKVIFDTAEAALDCAAELTRLLGYRPQRAYPCGRSRRGHHHLSSDVDGAGRRLENSPE
jgi:hypothetical protein